MASSYGCEKMADYIAPRPALLLPSPLPKLRAAIAGSKSQLHGEDARTDKSFKFKA